MVWTSLSDSLQLSNDWQLLDLGDASLVRILTLSAPLTPALISTSGRFEIAQFDTDKSCIGLRAVRWESFPLIFELPKPVYFESNKLGLRLAPDFAAFTIKIEVSDMSITSSKNPVSVAAVAKEKSMVPMTVDLTAVEALPANPKRRGLIVQNASSSLMILGYTNAVSATAGKNFAQIPPGETYSSEIPYTGAIWMTTDVGKIAANSAIELESV